MNLFRFLWIFLFITLLLFSSIYEDAEDTKVSRWKLVNPSFPSHVSNLHDLDKESRIIEFDGEGTKCIYELKVKVKGITKQQKSEYWLSWQMKFSEDFVIIILLDTNMGEYYLIYTPGIANSYMQYGLGYSSNNGIWQTFRRNLQADIAYFDNRVKVVSIKSYVLKGNGRIDNIISERDKLIQKKTLKTKNKQEEILKKSKNILPIIRIVGKKLVQFSLGETYVEEGVSAYDKEGGEINVVSMENIDFNKIGRYMVLYMATDSDGNMVIDKRYVHVGDVPLNNEKLKRFEEINEDYRDEKDDVSGEKVQIRLWEREKNSNEN